MYFCQLVAGFGDAGFLVLDQGYARRQCCPHACVLPTPLDFGAVLLPRIFRAFPSCQDVITTVARFCGGSGCRNFRGWGSEQRQRPRSEPLDVCCLLFWYSFDFMLWCLWFFLNLNFKCQNEKMFELNSKILNFCLIEAFCWTAGTINRFLTMIIPGFQWYPLDVLTVLFGSMQGFLNAYDQMNSITVTHIHISLINSLSPKNLKKNEKKKSCRPHQTLRIVGKMDAFRKKSKKSSLELI